VSVATDDVDVARDRRLVRRCREGESDAFGTLYAVYHDRLVRHCGRRLPDRGAAEDVAQEAFIRAWRAMDRFEIDRPFYPWLQAIASNACTDVLRDIDRPHRCRNCAAPPRSTTGGASRST